MKNDVVKTITAAVPDTTVRVLRRIEVGAVIHQGDVYLHAVAADWPRGNERGSRQVAVGSTVGARHVAVGNVQVYDGKSLPVGVKIPAWTTIDEILGPVVVASSTWTLKHPEHAHHKLPAGTYQVTYQADYTTRRRVQD